MNSDLYCDILVNKLKLDIRNKRRGKLSKGVLFLHENARPHTSCKTVSTIIKLGFEVLEHPAYSPDLAPSGYFLFGLLKKEQGESSWRRRREGISRVSGRPAGGLCTEKTWQSGERSLSGDNGTYSKKNGGDNRRSRWAPDGWPYGLTGKTYQEWSPFYSWTKLSERKPYPQNIDLIRLRNSLRIARIMRKIIYELNRQMFVRIGKLELYLKILVHKIPFSKDDLRYEEQLRGLVERFSTIPTSWKVRSRSELLLNKLERLNPQAPAFLTSNLWI
ncbi:hypothetical protein LAZ67_X001539 [Cordylochernes scorpioides]|uniref:Histone-lysine N-methyltransferase SETMAR n=1 Tax=Cordylochernes scorpioides TaxID=51811 RepID=A0ABY6LWS1_9ARAC|nr:hypothetical protein LAZ67_X001539 [Cordylochernes scorpioides]